MKKLILFILALLAVLSLTVPAMAAADYVIDDANLLTTSEESNLQSKLEKISAEMQADIVVLTVDSLNGKYIRSYADERFWKILEIE